MLKVSNPKEDKVLAVCTTFYFICSKILSYFKNPSTFMKFLDFLLGHRTLGGVLINPKMALKLGKFTMVSQPIDLG